MEVSFRDEHKNGPHLILTNLSGMLSKTKLELGLFYEQNLDLTKKAKQVLLASFG